MGLLLVVVLLVISLLIICLGHWLFPILPPYFYQTLVLLFLGTVGIFFYLLDVRRNRPDYFVQLYIATQFVKILAYGSYMLFVVWDDRIAAPDHVLVFMITYFLFTVVEIIFLYRKVSR